MPTDVFDLVRRDAYRMGVEEAGELLTLQYAAWVIEAIENETLAIPTLQETLDDVRGQLTDPAFTVFGLRRASRLIATVRTTVKGDGVGYIGRLGVVPDLHGQGLGSAMLRLAEQALPADTSLITLVTGTRSVSNHGFYQRHGYAIVSRNEELGYVTLEKRVSGTG